MISVLGSDVDRQERNYPLLFSGEAISLPNLCCRKDQHDICDGVTMPRKQFECGIMGGLTDSSSAEHRLGEGGGGVDNMAP